MIRWLAREVVTAPTGSLSLEDAKAFSCKTRTDRETYDQLFRILLDGVVARYEARLNRAVFPQRRRVTGRCAVAATHIKLEPHTSLIVRAGNSLTTLLEVADHYSSADGEVVFEPYGLSGDWFTCEYDCGWQVLPDDMKMSMLAWVNREYQRRLETVSQSGTVVLSPRVPDVGHYVVATDHRPIVGAA